MRLQSLGQQLVQLQLIAPVQPIHRLLEPKLRLGTLKGSAELIGKRRKVPLERNRHRRSLPRLPQSPTRRDSVVIHGAKRPLA
jgi:hypothetical protein